MSAWTTIPLFVSSTFRDMHAERDWLNNAIFPAIQEKLQQRRCRLEPIDLRIGIEATTTQTERERELQILKVCLAEIERSRPFMLVLLGDRYGWVPGDDRVQAAAAEADFPGAQSGVSVTALEIQYGLLKRNPSQKRRCLLCMREPFAYERIPASQAVIYSDAYAADAGAADRVRRLGILKDYIGADPELIEHCLPYHLGWDEKRLAPVQSDIVAWGQQVEAALWRMLDEETQQYANRTEVTWDEQERFVLEEMIERLGHGFVGRGPLVRVALELANSPAKDGAPWGICFTGATGSGKSALFARLHRELSGIPGVLLLTHAAGLSARAGHTDWMLRRWIGELGSALGEVPTLPDGIPSDELEALFEQWLLRAAATRRVVVLVDALDQFLPTGRAQHVSWLPIAWPVNCRFFATAICGEETGQLASRSGLALMELPLLDATEAGTVAQQVYARYHRVPNAHVMQELMAREGKDFAPAAGNPLWLTLAVDLLNQLDADDFTAAESAAGTLGMEKLADYLATRARTLPPDVTGLYGVLLDRVAKVAGIAETRAFTTLLVLSRHGWREQDFSQLLPRTASLLCSPEDRPSGSSPAHFTWDALKFAVLRRCFRAQLVRRGTGEQWDFVHATFREAILAHFPASAKQRETVHGYILDHFEALPSDDVVARSEKMFHVIGHRNPCRAARYIAQLAASGLVTNSEGTRELAEPLGVALTVPGPISTPESVLDWLTTIVRDRDNGYPEHVVAFAVFCLDDLLQANPVVATDQIRERLLCAAQATVQEEFERKTKQLERESEERAAYLVVVPERIAQIEHEQAVCFARTKSALSTVIQRKLAAIYRKSDLPAAREANRKAFDYSLEFFDASQLRLRESSAAASVSIFEEMVDTLNKGSIYLAPGLQALFRDGEFLLEMGRYAMAENVFSAVGHGGERIRGFFDPAIEKLIAGSHLLAAEALLSRGNPQIAVERCREAQEGLESALPAILENECASSGFTIPDGASMEDILGLHDGDAKLKVHGWPTASEWRYLISISHGKRGKALLAGAHPEEALEEYRCAERILLQLLQQEPSHPHYQTSKALIHYGMGRCYMAKENRVSAVEQFDQSRALFEARLRRTGNAQWMRLCLANAADAAERIRMTLSGEDSSEELLARRRELGGADDVMPCISLSKETGERWAENDAEYIFMVMATIRCDELPEIAISESGASLGQQFYVRENKIAPAQILDEVARGKTAAPPIDPPRTWREEVAELLQSGKTPRALALLRPILFPNECPSMDHDAPLEARIAFLHALMLAQNTDGFQIHLREIPEQEDSRVRDLCTILERWKMSFTWAQRFGLRAKPPLPAPAPNSWLENSGQAAL